MRRTRFADWDCSVARATDILGDWWTPLVVRSALLGVRRFDDFVEMLGIPRNVLTERLSRLVDEGILRKVAYQEAPGALRVPAHREGPRPLPGDRHAARVGERVLRVARRGATRPPRRPHTGERIDPVLVDGRTGEPLDPRRTKAVYVRDPKAGRAAVPSR